MRIADAKSGLATGKVELKRGEDEQGKPIVLPLTLTALPMGFLDTVRKVVPPPKVKNIGVQKAAGVVVRDVTGAPVLETNEDTPDYLAQEFVANRRQSCLMIWKGLQGDQDVEFEADHPAASMDGDDKSARKDWQAFADLVHQELCDFGLAVGDFGVLLSEVLRISNVGSDKLVAAREAFLSAE